MYSLLINGDVTSSDFVLNDGDTILIGGLQSRASIMGEVIRPAIYEIAPNESLEEIIKFALGTTPFADLSNISIWNPKKKGADKIKYAEDKDGKKIRLFK